MDADELDVLFGSDSSSADEHESLHPPASSPSSLPLPFEMFDSTQLGGGKGLRALVFIKADTEIFLDVATLRCPNSFAASTEAEAMRLQSECVQLRFERLSKTAQASLMQLSSHSEAKGEETISGIFQTNGVRLQGKDSADGAICETFCRMNHSCVPNVGHQWNCDLQRLVLMALKDIPLGSEMYTCYGGNADGTSTTTERRAHLLKEFKFVCKCEACVIDDR